LAFLVHENTPDLIRPFSDGEGYAMLSASTSPRARNFSADILDELSAVDLMSPDPISLRAEASVAEAIALFTNRVISGAPVVDLRGRPIGVLTGTDLLIHERERLYRGIAWSQDYRGQSLSDLLENACLGGSYQVAEVDDATVGSIMTPVVFSVRTQTKARKIISEFAALQVHRLFVIDEADVLVGVISALDVMKGLTEKI
jgi:CBS-domain-containing membrane protein